MKKLFILLFIAISGCLSVYAYTTDSLAPEIGQRCPDFTLGNVLYYPKTEISLADLKGKWFILDFWSSRCGACIEKMPKMNELQKEMGGKLQIILLGWDDPYIRPMYEKLRKLKKIDLPISYQTRLTRQFEANGLPFLVIADDKGVVRALTYQINKKQMDTFLMGGNPSLQLHTSVRQRHDTTFIFDYNKPFMVKGNGGPGDQFLFRSILSKWTPQIETSEVEFAGFFKWNNFLKNGIQEIGIPLKALYSIAYNGKQFLHPGDSLYGRRWQRPILEMRDSSIFIFDGFEGKNMFCYSLIVPQEQATDDNLKRIMKQDLKNNFGYDVVFEKRKMPYWRLVATETARVKLKTKGAPFDELQNYQSSATGFIFTNRPVNDLLIKLTGLYPYDSLFLDETGIDGNIDITLEGELDNFNKLRKALQKNGLDLLQGEKLMTVVVIRDPAPVGVDNNE
jgi:thiol-disulfide isomerase/thioredoxin